jgi:hypothetical protein
MTSFSGLVLFQLLFKQLDLKAKLRKAFGPEDRERSYGLATVVLQLVVQVLLGFRRLRDRDYFADDPLVCRVLGVARLPDVSTISRTLATATGKCVTRLQALLKQLVLDRLRKLELATVTIDFDGTVQTTRRHAEGSAVGYNKMRKGARSYYPLLCTVSQTGQVFDMHHRPGNVHDSNGADDFIVECIRDVRLALPRARVESRLDSAFFSDRVLAVLESLAVEYSVTVPFERFPGLRARIDRRTSGWQRIDDTSSFVELDWGPDCWPASEERRVFAIRTKVPTRRKGPLQLDLFEPREHGYDFKVIITNKSASASSAVRFHDGRGCQEAIIGESKQWASLDYVPCRRLAANQLYSCSALLAHNLARELQMSVDEPRTRRATPSRAAAFAFSTLGTLRNLLLRRAGSLTRPAGRLTLTVAASGVAREEFDRIADQLQQAA